MTDTEEEIKKTEQRDNLKFQFERILYCGLACWVVLFGTSYITMIASMGIDYLRGIPYNAPPHLYTRIICWVMATSLSAAIFWGVIFFFYEFFFTDSYGCGLGSNDNLGEHTADTHARNRRDGEW